MKEFVTSATKADQAIEDAAPLEFTFDGTKMTIYPPTTGQIAMMMHAQSSDNMSTMISGIIDFLFGVMDESSVSTLKQRLFDRNDPFDFPQVQEILDWAMEEWSGRPTT